MYENLLLIVMLLMDLVVIVFIKDFLTKQILLRCVNMGDLYLVTPTALTLLTSPTSL